MKGKRGGEKRVEIKGVRGYNMRHPEETSLIEKRIRELSRKSDSEAEACQREVEFSWVMRAEGRESV